MFVLLCTVLLTTQTVQGDLSFLTDMLTGQVSKCLFSCKIYFLFTYIYKYRVFTKILPTLAPRLRQIMKLSMHIIQFEKNTCLFIYFLFSFIEKLQLLFEHSSSFFFNSHLMYTNGIHTYNRVNRYRGLTSSATVM